MLDIFIYTLVSQIKSSTLKLAWRRSMKDWTPSLISFAIAFIFPANQAEIVVLLRLDLGLLPVVLI